MYLSVVGATLLQPCVYAESAQTEGAIETPIAVPADKVVSVTEFGSGAEPVVTPAPGEQSGGDYVISGTGSLVGRKIALITSDYAYRGTGALKGNTMNLILYQDITNPWGVATMNWSVAFNITTSEGTQTLLSCTGSRLICVLSDQVTGTEATPYEITSLDTSNPNNITWEIHEEIDAKSFGMADITTSMRAVGGDI
jgi:hypothetical protein